MRAELEDFKTGWFGLKLGLGASAIDEGVARLIYLKANPEQHFHWRSGYGGEGGIGDIEVYVAGADAKPKQVLEHG